MSKLAMFNLKKKSSPIDLEAALRTGISMLCKILEKKGEEKKVQQGCYSEYVSENSKNTQMWSIISTISSG